MKQAKTWILHHKKQLLLGAGGAALLCVIIQIIYPSTQLVPFLRVDTVAIGGLTRDEAAKKLDILYERQPIKILLGDQDTVTKVVRPTDIGLTVHNQSRVDGYSYPLLWRLVPTSLLWYHLMQPYGEPTMERDNTKTEDFITQQFGEKCVIKPTNASIKADGTTLKVIDAKNGGTCSLDTVRTQLREVTVTPGKQVALRVKVEVKKAAVSTKDAHRLAEKIEQHTGSGVELIVKESTKKITTKQLYSWLDFTVKDKQLVASLSAKRAAGYLDKNVAPSVIVPAGKTTIVTRDFTVISEKKGKNGVALDRTETLAAILDVMLGEKTKANAQTKTLKPAVTYNRSYSKTSIGITAMLQHYADDHPGTFGVSFIELEGNKSAEYNSTKSFITASTYKLFVAYDTLRKVEKGDWEWSDKVVDSRNLSTCFDDMIVKSDNACAEALYKKIGYQKVIDDVRKLGLTNTTLGSDAQRTTAGDLALFLQKLSRGSIDLKSSSRDRLLAAMKRNVYRNGIPAGTSATVADKVGFLNGLLHDAAIVSSSKGDYVLVVMSDGSSWANIAEITKKIEALR